MLATTRKDIDAKVVGGALIVSFLGAEHPKVWRAEMGGLSTATFELLEKGKDFSVVMRRDGTEEKIVTFDDKDSALYALQVMTAAMLKGGNGGSGNFFGTLAKACVIVIAVILVGKLFLGPPSVMGPQQRAQMSGTEMGSGALVKQGEPVPANELFGGK